MAIFIQKPWYRKSGGDPDSYFDPVTHIATEENFIKFLNCGVYDSKYIGYGVTLSNSNNYDSGIWIIEDVNHDSSNTNQSNCYDLISRDCFGSVSAGGTNRWSSTGIRSYLNQDFYNGFSQGFKSHILNMVYKSEYSWLSDYIIIPSAKELNYYGESTGSTIYEGVPYSKYISGSTRRKKYAGTSDYKMYWTRTKNTESSGYLVAVNNNGSFTGALQFGSEPIAPLMRVQ